MSTEPAKQSRLSLIKAGFTGESHKRGRLIVALDKIIEDTKNERKTFRNMEGLIASVKAVGVIEPITVTPEGDRYRIVTGHRRYRAALAAGLQTIEVLIRDPEDEIQRRRKSVVSNVQREDVGAIEMAEALQALLEEDGEIKTQRELAAIIGKREAWVSDMLSVLTLPTPLQAKLRISEVSVPYDTVMRIARVKGDKHQEKLLDFAISGAPAAEVRERIKEVKGTKPKNERVAVSVDGYTAAVTGPKRTNSRQKMLETAKELVRKISTME